jgi:hypothetical protein
MTYAELFWLIYILSILFALWANYESANTVWIRRFGGYTVLWVLVGILGYKVFGAAVK